VAALKFAICLLEGQRVDRRKGDWKLPVKRKPPPKLRPQSPAQELPPEMSAEELGEKKGKRLGCYSQALTIRNSSGIALTDPRKWTREKKSAKPQFIGMVLDDKAQTVLADLGAGSSKETY
jgi:hypothetical protein